MRLFCANPVGEDSWVTIAASFHFCQDQPQKVSSLATLPPGPGTITIEVLQQLAEKEVAPEFIVAIVPCLVPKTNTASIIANCMGACTNLRIDIARVAAALAARSNGIKERVICVLAYGKVTSTQALRTLAAEWINMQDKMTIVSGALKKLLQDRALCVTGGKWEKKGKGQTESYAYEFWTNEKKTVKISVEWHFHLNHHGNKEVTLILGLRTRRTDTIQGRERGRATTFDTKIFKELCEGSKKQYEYRSKK